MTTHPPLHVKLAPHLTGRAPTTRELLDGIIGAPTDGVDVVGPPAPTGFEALDRVLGGGLRVHELTLLGGAPGVGKTIAALQMARTIARAGRLAAYVCFEHDAASLLGRLLHLEIGAAGQLPRVLSDLQEAVAVPGALRELATVDPVVSTAVDTIEEYGNRLLLVPASGAHTGLEEVAELVAVDGDVRPVVFVDYLQKISVKPEPADETAKVTHVTEALKDLALEQDCAVVALVAADRSALEGGRIRLHHLRGSSALAYEADVAILMNEKHRVVAKAHLAYDSVRAKTYRDYVVFSIEKNRRGQAQIDVEFRKDFGNYRFHPEGQHVQERLIDERLEDV